MKFSPYRIAFGVAVAGVLWSSTTYAAEGSAVYTANCVACHQPEGTGLPPTFPALQGNEFVTGDPVEVINLILKGRAGTAMLSFARLSSDDIAAVLTYIRSSWGNSADEVLAEEVQALR